MQVTLTISSDSIKQLAYDLAQNICKELAVLKGLPETAPKQKELLTIQVVAKRLKLHEKTVINYIRKGRIIAANHGTLSRPKYRISEDDCEEFYRANRRS